MKTLFLFAAAISLVAQATFAQPAIRPLSRLYDCWGFFDEMDIVGDQVYIAGGDGLRVLDISDPANPTQLGLYSDVWGDEVSASGNVACVHDGNYRRVSIFDVSDPANIRWISNLDTVDGVPLIWDSWWDLKLIGNRLYADWDEYLLVFDLSDPQSPHLIGTYNENWLGRNICGVEGDYVFMGANDGVSAIDFSDLNNPTQTSVQMGNNYCAVEQNGFLYCSLRNHHLSVWDVHDPMNSQEVALLQNMPQGFICIGDGFLCLSDSVVHVFDVTTPSNPVEVASFKPVKTQGSSHPVANGSHLLFSTSDEQVVICDLSDPRNPRRVGAYPEVGKVMDVEISGNDAFVAAGEAGLRVVNFSDPTNPREITNLPVASRVDKLTLAANLAYMASTSGRLLVADVSQPENPSLLYEGDSVGAKAMCVVGNYLYVGLGRWLYTFDVSNPSAPRKADSLQVENCINGLVSNGEILFAVDGQWDDFQDIEHGKFYSFSLVNPESPAILGSYETGEAHCLLIRDSLAFVGCSPPYGLNDYCSMVKILNISEPSSPVKAAQIFIADGGWYICVNSVWADDDRMVVGLGWSGKLEAWDISDIRNSSRMASQSTWSSLRNFEMNGELAIVAEQRNLGFYDLSEVFLSAPQSPVLKPASILLSSFPNPFNSSTSISYQLPFASPVRLSIFDLTGREVATLVNGEKKAGYYRIVWDGKNTDGMPVTSGMYFVRLESPGFSKVSKVVMMR